MNGATTLGADKMACKIGMKTEEKIEINLGRVAAWTLVFTNTFFVSYFFAKLLRWV